MLSRDVFKQWVLRYFDDDLSDDELKQFNEYLKSSPSCRKVLLELSEEECQWHKVFEDKPQLSPKSKWLNFDMLALYAAALFFLSLPGIWLFVILTRPDPLSFSIESATSLAKGSMMNAKELNHGKEYDLSEGKVTLVFSEGTKIDLTAPISWMCKPRYDQTEFHVIKGDIQSIIQKQLPEQPFIFQSEHMKNIIVGTEILMKVKDSYSELEVVEGKVRSQVNGETSFIKDISAGKRIVMDKLGEWSRLLEASKHKPLASFNDRPLRDYVFKTSSEVDDLSIEVEQGTQEELIDIKVESKVNENSAGNCHAFIKPDRMPEALKGVRFWVKGEGSQASYQFRIHSEDHFLKTELIDDNSDWKVIELTWDEFKSLHSGDSLIPFDSSDMEYLSFEFSNTIDLSVKYFEFLR